MSKNLAMLLFTVGLLVTAGGVGGVEHSESTLALLGATLVSGLGLLAMWIGTEGLKDTY